MTASTLPLDTIVVGDCIDLMASWPEASVDLVFADPPYNIGYAYDQYDDHRDAQEYVAWTFRWIDACVRLLKPSGSLYVLIGDEFAAETCLHLKSLQKDQRLALRNWIIWHYTFGQNCKAKFNRSHAHLFYAVGPAVIREGLNLGKGLPFTFNREAVAVPSARQTTYKDLRANPGGKLPDDVWYLRPQAAMDAGEAYFSLESDTWYQSRLAGTFRERVAWHPCQLPEALLERIVRLSSNEGDVVFDPFAGSGTTAAVAGRLKRRWLGCELSRDYAVKAQARAEHARDTGQALLSSKADKGIVEGGPTKKKPEPHRSAGLIEKARRGRRSALDPERGSALFPTEEG